MQERLSDILEASVREFIRTGEPISSGRLYERFNFGIRPARIRSELQELTDQGFLEQPYHSAGRVPSDRGYQFFVEKVLTDEPRRASLERTLGNLFHKAEWENLLESLSDEFGILSVINDYDRGQVYKEGLDALVDNLELESPSEIRQIIRDFEQLEERLAAVRSMMTKNGAVSVFIGRKSPITKSPQLSVIAEEYGDEGKNVLLLAIGPKRMDYQKVISIFRNF